MKNSSLLSSTSDKNKSAIKKKQSILLPPIVQALKYQNDYQTYEDDFTKFKSTQLKVQDSPNISSELSKASRVSSVLSSEISIQSPKEVAKLPSKPLQQYISYEDSPQFWTRDLSNQTNPYIHHDQRDQYTSISLQTLQQQIKVMRHQFIQLNQQLDQMLDTYSLAKAQLIPKQLMKPSKLQFYLNQVQTNKKVEQAQVAQLKKLSETQNSVKDKDILLDLEHLTIQLNKQLHNRKKEEHDRRLKLHKQDLKLDDIIKVNDDNEHNNLVNLLKLQIVYYMKKQNCLKIQEQQLDHEEKLIKQNDNNLDKKLEDIKITNKNFVFVDQDYLSSKEKYDQLLQAKASIKKSIQTLNRSNEIREEQIARELLNINEEIRIKIKPRIIMNEQSIEEIQQTINKLIFAYSLNHKLLKEISYKFSEDLLQNNSSIKSKSKSALKNFLKPNLKSQALSKPFNFKTIDQSMPNNHRQRFLSSKLNNVDSLQLLKNDNNSKSSQKIANRYNDKNMTIDATTQNNKVQNSMNYSSNIQKNTLKPKSFRNSNKKTSNTQNHKQKSISITLQNSPFNSQYTNKLKILKPQFFGSKLAKT